MSSVRGASSPSKPADRADLFKGVRFFLNDSIPPTVRAKLADLLESKGAVASRQPSAPAPARRFDCAHVSHIITDTLDFPEYADVLQRNADDSLVQQGIVPIQVVSPLWVTKSQDLQALQTPRFYSADRALYFSGLVFCTSELPDTDSAAIQAGVTSLGGQWRYDLTREVTHLFVVSPSGPKYDAAIKYGPALGMVALLPHWFEECLKLRQPVPIDTYQFPDPPLLRLSEWGSKKSFEERMADYFKQKSLEPPPKKSSYNSSTSEILGVLPGGNSMLAGRNKATNDTYQRTATVQLEKPASADLANGSNSSKGQFPTAIDLAECTAKIFSQRIVYLASDLGLRPGLEEALKQRVEEAGGECWSWGVDGANANQTDVSDSWDRRRRAEKALKRANTVVTRSREGWEFWEAYDQGKTIGNLPWMYHVLATSKLDSPLDHLLHYPLPPSPVPQFVNLLVTISNYSGPARDYVRTMIESLGGAFEGAMSKKTRYVVTASEFGQKVKHARQWNVPVVSHVWLENCISEWAWIEPSAAAAFAPHAAPSTNFMTILGHTQLKKAAVAKWAALPESLAAKQLALKQPEMDAEPEHEREDADDDDEVGMEVDLGVALFGDEVDQAEEPMAIDRLEPERDESPPPLKSKGKGKAKEVPIVVKESSELVKAKSKRPQVIEVDEDDDDEDDTPAPAPPLRARKPASSSVRKPFVKPDTSADDEEEEEEAVVVRSPPKASTSAAPLAAAANGKARAVSSALSTALSSPSSSEESEPEHTPPQRIDFQNVIPVTGRRAAASLASKRLAEQMPDANKFAKEAKEFKNSGKKRRRSSQVRQKSANASDDDSSDASEDGEADARRKLAKTKATGLTSTSKPESKAVKKAVPAKKSAMKSAVGRSAAAVTQDGGAISSFDNPPHAAPPKKLVKVRVGPKKVRILMTGLGVTSDSTEYIEWASKLAKFGAKFTEAPNEATHLVVKSISRTEKFLCALAFAPFIVTRKWIDDSISEGALLDEQDYLLHDIVKERELGETLEAIVTRARTKKLFQGCTFYLTKSVLPTVSTIRRVVECSGGQVTMATFDRIAASPTIFIISNIKDRTKWEKFASRPEGKVYSVEAVFQSVVHQEFRFSDDYRIDLQL